MAIIGWPAVKKAWFNRCILTYVQENKVNNVKSFVHYNWWNLKEKSNNTGEYKTKLQTKKKGTLLSSPIYWEIIITNVWFFKLTVSNNTSIKNITSIKCQPQQQRGQQKFANLMPTLFLLRSTTLHQPIFS